MSHFRQSRGMGYIERCKGQDSKELGTKKKKKSKHTEAGNEHIKPLKVTQGDLLSVQAKSSTTVCKLFCFCGPKLRDKTPGALTL